MNRKINCGLKETAGISGFFRISCMRTDASGIFFLLPIFKKTPRLTDRFLWLTDDRTQLAVEFPELR